MQETREQETREPREYRVITRTLDGFVEYYRNSIGDNERAKTDRCAKDFLRFLTPGDFEKYWDYYEKGKES